MHAVVCVCVGGARRVCVVRGVCVAGDVCGWCVYCMCVCVCVVGGVHAVCVGAVYVLCVWGGVHAMCVYGVRVYGV